MRTPKYKNPDITEPVEVFIELFRPSDQDRSEEMSFKYKPRSYLTPRKKPRMASSSSSSLSSGELPTTIRGMSTINPSFENYSFSQNLNSMESISGLSGGLNSEELNRIVKESDPSNTLPMLNIQDQEFDLFYRQNGSQYHQQVNLMDHTIEVDGVIHRGPNAPPMVRHSSTVNKRNESNSIMRELNSVLANKNLSHDQTRDNILRIISENVTERGEKYVFFYFF